MAKTLLIFGGSGFIGSYIVRRLSKLGFRIIIPTSKPSKSKHLKLSGSVGQVLPIKLNFKNFNEIKKIMNKSDIIIKNTETKISGMVLKDGNIFITRDKDITLKSEFLSEVNLNKS